MVFDMLLLYANKLLCEGFTMQEDGPVCLLQVSSEGKGDMVYKTLHCYKVQVDIFLQVVIQITMIRTYLQ